MYHYLIFRLYEIKNNVFVKNNVNKICEYIYHEYKCTKIMAVYCLQCFVCISS